MTSPRNSRAAYLALALSVLAVLASFIDRPSAQGIAIPNTFINGAAADADAVNANFAALANNAVNRTGGTMTGTLNVRALLPTADATYDLGGVGARFKDAYFSGTVTAASFVGGVPSNAVIFYNGAACPSGWTELTSARGRYLVGLPSGGTLAGTAGTALSDLENRPTGQHNHTATTSITYYTQSAGGSHTAFSEAGFYDSTASGSIASATTTVNNSSGVAGTNAPFLQLLVCQKS